MCCSSLARGVYGVCVVFVGLSLLLADPVGATESEEAMNVLRERLRIFLLDDPDTGRIRQFVDTLQDDGSWADINYKDRRSAGWEPLLHVRRLQEMAQAFAHPDHAMAGDPKLLDATIRGLDFWIASGIRRPVGSTWMNFIGIPSAVGPVLLLLEDHLTAEQKEAGLRIVTFESRYRIWKGYDGIDYLWSGEEAAGQNRLWLIRIHLIAAALRGDEDHVRKCLHDVADELRMDRPMRRVEHKGNEGIQVDFSFHQHGPQLYNGGYGMAFGNGAAWFVAVTHQTPFAFDDETQAIVMDYMLEGQRWMLFGDAFEYGSLGRDITRSSARSRGRGLLDGLEWLMAMDPDERPKLEAMMREIQGVDSPSLEGHRHFWKSDFTVHRRSGFYTSVKMNSVRTLGTETGNGEGLKNYYLADGCTFIFQDGKEYEDIFPVWDWTRIPGVTCEWLGEPPEMEDWGAVDGVTSVRRGYTSFVGSVSDGWRGASAMDYQRDGVAARKAWFHFDTEWVALGAGITGRTQWPILTSVNQCLLRTAVLTNAGPVSSPGEDVIQGPCWVLHDGIGYVFPEEQTVELRHGPQHGNWHHINRRHPDEPVTKDVFNLWIDHGAEPDNDTYFYMVVPGADARRLNTYLDSSDINVLSNAPELQALYHRGLGVLQAVFYEAGELELHDGGSVRVDQPCMLMIDHSGSAIQISVSSPEAKAMRVDVMYRPPSALSDRREPVRITFNLPAEEAAGSTVTRVAEAATFAEP